MGRLAGETAIVTGAGQGIGAAIAKMFAAEGAAVLCADIRADTAAAVAAEIVAAGGRAVSAVADIADEEQAMALAGIVERDLGPATILVNNAGIAVFDDPLKLSAEDWRRCMSVDLEGVWFCTKGVLPGMLERGRGSVVNIASVHSFKIIAGCFPYPVAKHGVVGMTRALAVEYGAKGVRFNAICPSYIATQINVDYFATMPDPEAARRRVEELHPVKHLGEPEDVAYGALYLASKESSFVTGSCLMIDGGRSVVFHD